MEETEDHMQRRGPATQCHSQPADQQERHQQDEQRDSPQLSPVQVEQWETKNHLKPLCFGVVFSNH